MNTPASASRRTVLFDMDGTLSDPEVGFTRCVAYAMERLGLPVPPPSELRQYIGPPTAVVFSSLLQTDDQTKIMEAVRIYRERLEAIGYKENTPYEGVPALLHTLRAEGYTLGVATARATVYANLILGELALVDHFDFVFGTDPTILDTPKTKTLGYALEHCPGPVCLVGDRYHDVEAARSHGVWSIGVTYGYGSETELTEAGADVICHSPAEVLTAVRTWTA